jgi:hypothetical protein
MTNPTASVAIAAPIEQVWAVMVDTTSYGEWNPFVVKAECDVPPKVGDPIVLHVRWANGRGTKSPERISVVEPPHEEGGLRRATLAYVYEGIPSKLGLVHGTRYQRLWQQPGGPTHYDTVEEFSGPLVPLAGPKRVEEGFRRHAEALKRRCEG